MTAFDVIVLGAGPAGTVCALELARRGRRVVLLDADLTPRYRVGESLSPTACAVLESVGVNLAEAGFVAKHGATFRWGQRGAFRTRYAGATAWQARRAELDTMLVKLAEDAGVQVRTGHRVDRVRFTGPRATGVRIPGPGADALELDSSWVVDATGRQAVLANQLRLLEAQSADGLDTPATDGGGWLVWGYWRNGGRLAGDAAGDGLFVGSGGRAWWYLPVDDRDNVVAAGVVLPGLSPGKPVLSAERVTDAYLAAVGQAPRISDMLAGAQLVGGVHTAPHGSQVSRELVGPGWLIVGDAAGFVDPILTPGVQLAVQFGQLAAGVVDAALAGGSGADRALRDYQRRLRRQHDTYRWLATNLYAAAEPECAAPTTSTATDERSDTDEQSDRLTFLSVIAGIPTHRLGPLLGEYLAMRTAATPYGGAAPVFGETEGFAFLTWLNDRRQQGGDAVVAPVSTVRLAPGTTVEETAGDQAAGPVIRVARTRGGERFLLTWELETLLRILTRDGGPAELARRFATASGARPDPLAFGRWLDLLARHGLVECLPERAEENSGATMEAGRQCDG
jgi:flavin-dependent dehydrogenase